ncbi:leucyl aminopeptidase family protein [Falsiroseomonas selenitidurans]|uniref:Leucyl aminopeptidase family protein n=1 Tax=Falsiroseomonas selenitidurans TaxID=2716335 RepID=A0ABX1E7N2_9PROT|nr:leucyl aminopeptidase family protein [Falsiroseomonas selenitidurans]NKC31797.1 leucyl aminopeptidase family protein [Falsiroseomonas selenitidurans]
MLKPRFKRPPADPALPQVWPVPGEVPEVWRGVAEAAGFRARPAEVLRLGPDRLLVGLGVPEEAGAAAVAALGSGPGAVPHVVVMAEGLAPAVVAGFIAGMALRAWRFDAHRTQGVAPGLERVTLLVADPAACRAAWAMAEPAVRGCLFARDLVAEPANHLTTRNFARRLEGLAEFGIHVDVLGRKRLARAGYGALLAVGGGAAHPPRLAVLRWRGSFDAPPVVFVGKGLVFDTGGISIKPAKGMEAMRADMAGAAACAGALLALALRGSPAPAAAVLAIAENATGADSYRPGDVLRTGSGRTVEVVDTDAEGRLVLADALHHAVRVLRPRAVVDAATLTGAIVTALGHHRAGLFGRDAALLAAVAAAGEAVGERVWPMPIGAAHRADLASDIADIRQCVPAGTGRLQPDASHAAAFLAEFVPEAVPWAHLDIAGVDTQARPHALGPAGATGFGARLLDRLVATQFEEPPEPPAGRA